MGAGLAEVSALASLRSYLAARDEAEGFVAPTMRSQLFEGTTDEVIVLLHGLTASPPAWDGIAPLVHARGATVIVPRLPLHGHLDRMTNALRALTPEMLETDLNELFDRVRALGGRITVAGHSLGGTLALVAGARVPGVDRVIAVAPFLGITRVPHEVHRPLIAAMHLVPYVFLWWHPINKMKHQPPHGYPRYPIGALATGLRLGERAMRAPMPGARAIDVVLNGGESSVSNRTARHLARRWRAAGASVSLHRLCGLPRSHDIIESMRPYGERARATLAAIMLGEHDGTDHTYQI